MDLSSHTRADARRSAFANFISLVRHNIFAFNCLINFIIFYAIRLRNTSGSAVDSCYCLFSLEVRCYCSPKALLYINYFIIFKLGIVTTAILSINVRFVWNHLLRIQHLLLFKKKQISFANKDSPSPSCVIRILLLSVAEIVPRSGSCETPAAHHHRTHCMYMQSTHVRTHACTHARTHALTHARSRTHALTHAHSHTCTHIHNTCTHTHIHAHTHARARTYARSHALTHARTHALAHARTYGLTHTHQYTCLYACTYKHFKPEINKRNNNINNNNN